MTSIIAERETTTHYVFINENKQIAYDVCSLGVGEHKSPLNVTETWDLTNKS